MPLRVGHAVLHGSAGVLVGVGAIHGLQSEGGELKVGEALGRCVELETVDASKNGSMRGAIPVSWGCLIKLKEIKIDDTKVDAVPSEVFLSCESLQTLSAARCDVLDVKAMKETEGYQHYEARRKGKHDKQLSSRVLMDEARLDERLG